MADEDMAASGDGHAEEDVLGFGGARQARRIPPLAESTEAPSAVPESAREEYRRQRSFDAGDLPEGMEARYLIERRRLTGEQRYYENASDTKPAFRDRGDRLVADNDSRDLIRDMLDIAEHRGWDRVKVSGSEAFRRAAWREAALRGIEVDGYTPQPRERQEVERARARRDARVDAIAADVALKPRAKRDTAEHGRASRKDQGARRADFDAGISGHVVDIGEARYGGTATGRVTPYADIVAEDGRRARAWGVGLPKALREAGVVVGDQARLRRLGTERVHVTVAILNPDTEERSSEAREVNRNRWSAERILAADRGAASHHGEVSERRDPGGTATGRQRTVRHDAVGEARTQRTANRSSGDSGVEPANIGPSPARAAGKRDADVALADRFRNATSAEAARDPALMAAQSQFVAAKTIITSTLGHDPAAAERLVARSRETIARAIEQGRAIPQAELRGDRRTEPERNRPDRERVKDSGSSRDPPVVTKAPSRTRTR